MSIADGVASRAVTSVADNIRTVRRVTDAFSTAVIR